jgi:hypothetical protein
MANDGAWVSRAFMDTTLVRFLTVEGILNDIHWAADTMRRNERGEPMPAQRFPKELYGKYTGKKVKKLPDLCNALGTWLVSAALARVLRRFDLGRTLFHPTKAFQIDRKTPVEGEYFCINFGERKASFLPEQSHARKPWEDQDLWALQLAPKDDDIALGDAALEGPDLWIEEHFVDAFFLSDRLARALREAKLARHFGLRRCRVQTHQ